MLGNRSIIINSEVIMKRRKPLLKRAMICLMLFSILLVTGTVLANLITNGTFDAADWTAGDPDNWIVGDASANVLQNPANECQLIQFALDEAFIQQDNILVPGSTYRVTYDLTDDTGGTVIRVRNFAQNFLYDNAGTVGTHTKQFVADDAGITFNNDNGIFSIDNLVVVRVLTGGYRNGAPDRRTVYRSRY